MGLEPSIFVCQIWNFEVVFARTLPVPLCSASAQFLKCSFWKVSFCYSNLFTKSVTWARNAQHRENSIKTLEIIKPKFGKCKIPFRFVYKSGDVSLQTSNIEFFSELHLWGGACSLQPVPSCWSRAQTIKYCFWQLFFPIQLSWQNRWLGCRNYKIVTFQCWLWEILKEEWGHASKLILSIPAWKLRWSQSVS